MAKYLSEEELIDKVQTGEFTWLEYVRHHSKELNDEYEKYCRQRNLEQDKDSVEKFLAMKERQFEEAMENGDI